MSVHKNTVIVIAGPTASGKTALAVQLAKHFDTAVISADSRQCFKELSIGVAKPSAEELRAVKHYFIDSHSIHENVTARVFEEYALTAATEIFQRNTIAVMAGGTGLYIKAFCEGLDEIPDIDRKVRIQIIHNYQTYGIEWLQTEVRTIDPDFWTIAEQENPQRLMRALEVKKTTGQSIVHFRKGAKMARPFNIIKLGISISKEQLHKNIDWRTDEMMLKGLVNEAARLKPYRDINALRTVGYKEVFEYFDGKFSFEATIDEIKKNTRHYAKRQITWFKRDMGIKWVDADILLADINGYLATCTQ